VPPERKQGNKRDWGKKGSASSFCMEKSSGEGLVCFKAVKSHHAGGLPVPVGPEIKGKYKKKYRKRKKIR